MYGNNSNELHTSKEKCFEDSVAKANKAVTYPQVYQARPFCQVIPGQNNQIR